MIKRASNIPDLFYLIKDSALSISNIHWLTAFCLHYLSIIIDLQTNTGKPEYEGFFEIILNYFKIKCNPFGLQHVISVSCLSEFFSLKIMHA